MQQSFESMVGSFMTFECQLVIVHEFVANISFLAGTL